MSDFSITRFRDLLQPITEFISDRPLDQHLNRLLNTHYPADGATFQAIADACDAGIAAGQICQLEAGGIKYGRVIKPTPVLSDFSVDVVVMDNIKGPHHRHPLGEIDMVIPLDRNATFDNHSKGWVVYGPDSAHHPTVAGGTALILYLLPQGQIEFTRR